jgi:hypothetical protein
MRGGLNAGNGLESEALPKQMRIMYPGACSDFLIATFVYQQGLQTIYVPLAVCSGQFLLINAKIP